MAMALPINCASRNPLTAVFPMVAKSERVMDAAPRTSGILGWLSSGFIIMRTAAALLPPSRAEKCWDTLSV
ncbi:hypothetical protein HaLaN_31137 [Haematococcus lacustris]|uniref:Uncharacterized protein n=1 Tax=Haematococcus lacustris TaxID=44745 RepID=A0A6A0AI87_HAELA|nr:hypothetical protein HaLaN_31137 [Haematococcus lacustris]